MSEAMQARLLSDEDVQTLVMAVAYGQETFTEDDAQRVVEWAKGVLIDHGLLQNVLNGFMAINATGDDLTFTLTTKGIARAEALK